MIDEKLFIKWFNNQHDYELRCNDREYNCRMSACIQDYIDNHEFEEEVIKLIRDVLVNNYDSSYDYLAKRLFTVLENNGVFE